MSENTYSYFRNVAQAEGVSYLLLLGIAMPLKYVAGMPWAVKYVGWAHGVLFMWYMTVLVSISFRKDWGILRIIWALAAALLPFGPWLLDKKFLKD
jgi:integral membrane protein